MVTDGKLKKYFTGWAEAASFVNTENLKRAALICPQCYMVGQGTSSRWNQYKTKVPWNDEPAECTLTYLKGKTEICYVKHTVGHENAESPWWDRSSLLDYVKWRETLTLHLKIILFTIILFNVLEQSIICNLLSVFLMVCGSLAFCKTSKQVAQSLLEGNLHTQRASSPRGDPVINSNHKELINIILWEAVPVIWKSSTFYWGKDRGPLIIPCKSKCWIILSRDCFFSLFLFSGGDPTVTNIYERNTANPVLWLNLGVAVIWSCHRCESINTHIPLILCQY